jgi:cell division transport system permease protein
MNTQTSKLDQLRKKRYDLPLHRGSGGQLVAWTVGVMSYLTVLMLVVVFALSAVQKYWETGLTGRMTVEIPYKKGVSFSSNSKEELLQKLNALPGIQAHALTMDDIGKLVGPWLGTGEILEELPLPTLIDVTRLELQDTASLKEIETTAHSVIPDATLDTHEEWLADLMQLAKACRMILVVISVILALTAALTVAATAKTRLALHKAEVDLLHLIGATDSYIATQFQRQAFRLATEGAGAGLFLAIVTMAILGFAKQHLGDTLVPQLHLSWFEWITLLITPLIAGVIAMVASRFTVLHALKKMP